MVQAVAALDGGAPPVGAYEQVRPGVWWFGTSEGVVEWAGGSATTRIPGEPDRRDGLGGHDARAVLRDRSGNVWVGTETGLYLHRARTLPFRVFRQGALSDSRVNALAPDGAGGVWVATNGGLDRIDLRRGRVERTGVRVASATPRAFWQVLRTRAGRVLVGAKRGGVFQLSGGPGARRLAPFASYAEAWRRVGAVSIEGIRTLTEDARRPALGRLQRRARADGPRRHVGRLRPGRRDGRPLGPARERRLRAPGRAPRRRDRRRPVPLRRADADVRLARRAVRARRVVARGEPGRPGRALGRDLRRRARAHRATGHDVPHGGRRAAVRPRLRRRRRPRRRPVGEHGRRPRARRRGRWLRR